MPKNTIENASKLKVIIIELDNAPPARAKKEPSWANGEISSNLLSLKLHIHSSWLLQCRN